MKICIFHGSNRKGNTDKIISIAKEELIRECDGNVEFTDFYLPKDMPEFCLGCFACLNKGTKAGEFCPHKKYTEVIAKEIEESEGIIVGCPVYALAESAQVKALFDHFACTYMNHRPKKSNFKKSVLILSSCAGAGNGQTIRTIKRNFIFWGIPKIYSLGIKMWTGNWNEMTEEKQNELAHKIERKTEKFLYSIKTMKKNYAPLRTRLLFTAFRHLVRTYPEGQSDKVYYEENGWFGRKRPWKD